MDDQGIIRTYFVHPLTDGGANLPGEIRDNLISLECIVRLAIQQCPQIRPILPQTQWSCLIGVISYERALCWCRDELKTCSLVLWPQRGEGPLAGQLLVPTRGVLLEVAWAKEMERKEELGLFTDLGLMTQYVSDLRNGREPQEG